MTYPDFFDRAPAITVRDPLAEFLGAFEGGLITYGYLDAVRLAGHSCPTVASAYLMTRRALALLYPDAIPERGAVEVAFANPIDAGVTGVIGSVAGLITGAAGAGGFKGIGDRFRRQNLLRFGCDLQADARFTRSDNGASVQLGIRLNRVPGDPRMGALLQTCLYGHGSTEDAAQFATLWQDRVRRILLDHADDPELIVAA